jgi:hypothetical protein
MRARVGGVCHTGEGWLRRFFADSARIIRLVAEPIKSTAIEDP